MNKKNKDTSKMLEGLNLTQSHISEKTFNLVDKSAKKLSNMKESKEDRIKAENEVKDAIDKAKNDTDAINDLNKDKNTEYESRLKTKEVEKQSNNVPVNDKKSKLKTNTKNETNSTDNKEGTQKKTKTSKLKTTVSKKIDAVYKFNKNQGKVSKVATVAGKSGVVVSKVGKTLTRVSKDLSDAMEEEGTGNEFIKNKVKRKTRKTIKKKVNKKVKKPIKKVSKKIFSPITKRLTQALKVVLHKAISIIISGLSAISEFILPLAVVVIVVVSICFIFSWSDETIKKYQNYMDTVQEEYDKEVDQFLRDNPKGIVVGGRGGYGKINWRVPFAILQGLGADIEFDQAEKELLQKFRDAGLFEKHEIVEETTEDNGVETTVKMMIILNPGYEDYISWCNDNFSYIKSYMQKKGIFSANMNKIDDTQLEIIKSLCQSENAFDGFDSKYKDFIPSFSGTVAGMNLDSDNYNSKNTFARSGYKGQCTWFAYGRAKETANKSMPGGNAKTWLSSAIAMGYNTGSSPVTRSVIVLAGTTYGHVAFVESYDGNKITVSEGNVDNPCNRKNSGCDQVKYANEHAKELVRVRTYNSYSEYKKVNEALGLYIIGFIYL